MNKKIKAAISLVVFLAMYDYLWLQPQNELMGMHDWMCLIVLEVPLQLAIHFLTEKKC